MTPDSFASLPLDEQLAALAHALDSRPREHSESELLELCRAVRDHAPMAWLARELLARGWLNQAQHRERFAAFLIEQSETAVNKVLRSMLELELGPSARAPLAEMLVTCLEIIPLARLSSMCLIDRALKHNFSERRVRHHRDNLARLLQALERDELEQVNVDRLAQVSAHDFERLRALADAKGHRELLDTRHRELARQAVEVIASAPKAVSQSNAEELLARRVYTDPGHFLIELLQNAEDAGADTWRVVFDADAVTVWHNGAAFDTRDLVGVTSIGQTTKSKSQIGFFGVGFKSIYEITDRPRVFSDVYQFEIADISVPKVLGRRPRELPAEGTVLVLPLRDPSDPVRSPQALFDKARALDPCVLFTLRGIDAIELELTAAAPGGPQHHIIREGQPDAQQRSTLSIDPGEVQHYVVVDDEYRYTAAKRTAGRADSTRVMVGVRVDERGKPMPLSEGASTVYSYLPTAEHSGLRFFVQGHFDVPVDRERITQDSDWNRWILEQVPAQLAKVARNASAQGPELARGMLEVLPLEPELGSPVFRALTRRLRGALKEVPLLPGHGGSLHRPREVLIASQPIVALFDDQPVLAAHLPRALVVHSKAPQLVFLAPDLPERSVELAQALGCPSFTLEHLVSLLKVELGPSEDRPIAAMRAGEPARVREVYDVLLDGVEQLERERERLPLLGLVSKLKALPIVLDERGQFLHPRELVRAPRRLRRVYAGLTAFVHPELDALLREADAHTDAEADAATREDSAALDRCTAFFNRLGVATLEGPQLLGQLERELRERPVLERLEDTRLPGTPARLAALFEFLAIDATVELQRRAARLPLFAASDGRYYPIARSPADRAGVLIAHDDDLSQVLHAFYAGRRPIALLADCSEHVRTLLVQQQAPELDVSVLIDDLELGLFELDLDGFDALHTILEYDQERIHERDRKRLAKQAIWPDLRGTPRPLSGGGRVLMPGFPAIEQLFPRAPFIHPLVRGRSHVRDMGIEVVAAAAVLEALSPEARAPLTLTPSPEVIGAVLDFLFEHGEKLGSKGRKLLRELPLFLSDRGEVRRLAELRRATPELRALYGDYPGRHFLAEGSRSLAVIEKFALRSELLEATPGTLVEDLRQHAAALLDRNLLEPTAPLPLVGDAEGLIALLRYFTSHLDAMTRVEQESLASLPPKASLHRYYRCLETRLETQAEQLELEIRLRPGYAFASNFWQQAFHGQLVALPRMLGLPEAEVEARIEAHGVVCTIACPPHYRATSPRYRELEELPPALRSASTQVTEAHSFFADKLRELRAEVERREQVETELRAEIAVRRAAEAEREALQVQLQRAQRLEAIGLLAGGVAHDFNNLLVVILGQSELGQTMTEDPELRELLADIEGAGQRAAALTRQLLAFGRRQVMQVEVLSLAALVEGMEPILRRLMPANISLALDTERDTPVEGDPNQLEQVVLNLCVNARDAMAEGGELRVEVRPVVIEEALASALPGASVGAHVRLRVADTGSGIAPELLDKVFDPFFTTKGEGLGTGLGLSVVHGVVSQHGGTMQAASEPGRGTTMDVYLPLAEGRVEPRADTPTQEVRGGSETLLLVEDDAGVRRFASRVLRAAGYQVLEAADGERGLQLLREHIEGIDMLVLDVMLPGCLGRELHDAALELRSDMRVLYTSGYSTRGIHTDFVLERGLELLPKPYGASELLRRLRQVLDA